MVLRSLTAGLFLVSATSALAGSTTGAPTTVSLDDLKQQCAEFAANPQMKPVQVKITCNEQSFYWQAGDPATASLPNNRNVGATIMMKGYEVPQANYPITTAAMPIQCQTFVKVEKDIANVDSEITCSDLAAIEDLGAYCAPILDQAVTQNPALATTTATKETQSLCPQK